jgi:hypothetical protein
LDNFATMYGLTANLQGFVETEVSLSLFVVATRSLAGRPLDVVRPWGPPKIEPMKPPEWLTELDQERVSWAMALS